MKGRLVLARVFGGLGNQLFIYAAAKALALRTGARLLLDTRSRFANDDYGRHFALDAFQISAGIAPESLFTSPGQGGRALRAGLRRLSGLIPYGYRFYLSESASGGPEALLRMRVRRTIVMDGYWQDERYFNDCRPALKDELIPKDQSAIEDGELAREIVRSSGTGIHVRGYEDLTKAIGAIEGRATRLPAEYFHKAVETMQSRLNKSNFFVFSDNPEWARTIFGGRKGFRIVENSGPEGARRDLWLMSRCRHHILSNSSFSWWARWLSRSAGGLVIAPDTERWKTVLGLAPLPERWRAVLV